MRKILLLIAVVAMVLPSCKKIEESINALENRIEVLENETIPTIDEQIAAINVSLDALDATDKELKGYIDGLQATATNLQEQINATNTKIDEVKSALQNEISTAKAEVLAELEALETELKNELSQINATIETLKAKDAELGKKIDDLKSYVDTELGKTTDWVNATFATLTQYNALVAEVTAIKAQIVAINESIADLETRLTTKINEDIANAVSTLNSTIQQKVSEITTAYTEAVKAAKSEITAAYTAAIATAISNLETSLRSWVGEQLAGYYTIAEIDAMLATMEQEMNGKLEAQKAYLESLINELSEQLTKNIADNKELIDALREDLSSAQDEIATNKLAIANNSEQISKNATKITANAQSIAENSADIDGNSQKIKENKSLIEANETLINNNKSAITSLQANVDTATKAIAKNAEDIAKNAALISANATAIGNNAQAIADNATEIANLKTSLATTKQEITNAYKKAIEEAISTNNGVINSRIANEVATINTRINNEVTAINATIKSLTERIKSIESEISSIKQQIAEILGDITDIKEDVFALLARIQSVSYIPKYSDGKATIIYDGVKSQITLDFEISPKDAVAELAKVWQSALNLKAVYTETRAVPFVDMPIFSFEADTQNGVISVTASGDNLSAPFFADMQEASVRLAISDGNSSVTSEYIPMVVHHIAILDSHNASIETWYEDYNTSSMSLDGSTIYVDNIRLTGDITSDNVLALGVIVTDDDTFSKAATQSATLEISPIQISGLTSGVYTVRPYAKIFINGEVLELFGVETAKIVTSIPTLSCRVRTSYTINGNVVKDNSVPGDAVEIRVNISDSYIADNLVDGRKWEAGNYSGTIGNSIIYFNMSFGKYIFSIKATLQNGYMLEENDIEAYITGIPYILNTRSNDGWSTAGSVEWNTDGGVRLGYNSDSDSHMAKNFYVPEDIPVLVENTGTIMGGMIANSSSYHLVVGNTTYSISNTTPSSTESWNITPPEILLTASNPLITMYNKSKYTPIFDYVTIKGLTVIYAPDDI